MMQAFLMQDVEAAKNRILQRKHRERAVRPSNKKRKRRGRIANVPTTGVLCVPKIVKL